MISSSLGSLGAAIGELPKTHRMTAYSVDRERLDRTIVSALIGAS
jgi:hypothetical protein